MAEDSSTADKSHLGQEPECRQVVEAISDWIWACDSQWRITFSNKAVEQILGHSPQQAIGRNVLELLHPDDRDQARKAIEQALRDRCGWRHVHLRWLHKDGSVRRLEGSSHYLTDADGNFTGFAGRDRDITEQVKAEQQLREDQKRLQTIMTYSHDGISLCAVEGDTGFHRIVMCNDRFVEMSGYTRQQLMEAEDLRELSGIVSVTPDYRERKDKGQPRSGVSSWHRPDGKENYYEWNSCPILIDGKEHIIGIDRDITERVIAERGREEQRNRLEILMRHSSDGINICKVDLETGAHGLVLCNDRYVEMSGYSREELMGSPNLFGLTEAIEKHPNILDELRAGKACRGLSRWKRPDRKENYHEWTAVSTEIDGETHVLGIDRDATERILAERELRDANEKLQNIIDFLPDPTFVLGRDKKVVAWNRAMAELTGVDKESLLGKGAYAYGEPFYGYPRPILIDLVGTEDPHLEAKYEYVHRKGDTLIAENWVPFGPDGQPAHRWSIAAPIYDSEGEMIGAIESIRDNTAWLEARTKIEANEQAERSFRQSLQILHEINMGLTETESTRELTREAVELGRSRLGFDRLGIWLATDKPNTFAGSFGVDEQGKLRNEEDSRITVKRDRLLLRVVANQLPLAVVEDDDLLDDHRHVVGKGMRALAPLWDGQKVIGFVSTDNLLTKEPISQQKAEIFRLFASSLGHLYTRKQTERALRLERDFANTIIETAQAVILVLDRQCRIVRINPFGEELLGYTMAEVAGKDWISTFVPAHERDRIQEVFSSAVNDIQTRGNVNGVVTRDGRIRQVEWHDKTIKDAEGNCAGLMVIGLDVTERKMVEEELRQSQKMEAIGRFAGGIAHDFNNQLTVIKGYSDLLLRELTEENPLYEQIAEIDKAAQQAESLTSQLLAFGRKQMLNPEVVDLNDILSDMSNALKRMIGNRIQLRIVQSPDLGNVTADATQVRQALMNLVVNAWDAMPEGGRLTIRTRNVELSRQYAARHAGAKPGPHVLLSVRDTGIGMDEQTLLHAFEPFFTTKPPGEGTGLGLPMVYGFAQQSGGHMGVTSRPGRGTTFKAYLPRVEDEAGTPVAHPRPRLERRRKQTVLVAEDDQAIRKLVSRFLRDNGYSVVEAANGRQAMQIVRRRDRRIDILVTDVVMPEMGGGELANEVRKLCPDIPVLYVTGYAEKFALMRDRADGAERVLPKPFGPAEFGRAVRSLLDEAATQAD